MAIRFKVEDKGVSKALTAASKKLGDVSPLLRSIGVSGVEQVRIGFRRSSDPYGAPWKPLKRARRRQGSRSGAGDKPLIDTGVLRNSYTYALTDGNKAVVIGSSQKKAVWHQFGTRSKLGNLHIPPRKMLPEAGLPARWAEAFLKIADRYLRDD